MILRLRSALDTISLHHCGRRVLIVSHQVVVLCLRYLLENMTEEQILAIDRGRRRGQLLGHRIRLQPGCGKIGGMELRRYNFVAPLQRSRSAGDGRAR